MARRHPDAINQFVVVPDLAQTGKTVSVSLARCTVKVDQDKDLREHDLSEVYRLTWKDIGLLGENFVCRSKAWRGLTGARKLRVQVHHVHEGRVGRRIVILYKVNGETKIGW